MKNDVVYMMVSGRMAEVPADKADLVVKKQALIKAARLLETKVDTENQLIKIVKQIQSLSRRIGPCVRFI